MTSVALESSTVTTEYNGWTNRETWLTNLWLNNDMGSYEQLQEICRKDCKLWEKAEELETQFQDQLEEYVRLSDLLVRHHRHGTR